MKCPKNPKSRKFRRIVNRDCGGYRDYLGEYWCLHEYNWTCDECPVFNTKLNAKINNIQKSFITSLNF